MDTNTTTPGPPTVPLTLTGVTPAVRDVITREGWTVTGETATTVTVDHFQDWQDFVDRVTVERAFAQSKHRDADRRQVLAAFTRTLRLVTAHRNEAVAA